MSETAHVHNVEALKRFQHALWRFQEIANVALTEAESDMQRGQIWLETEQRTYWSAQVRKHHEAVEKAKQAVREKQLYKDGSGARSSAVDEMKLLQAAQRRLEEANQKIANVKKNIPRLQKETQMYRGGVQRFASTVQSDLPMAVAKLEQLSAALEAYVTLGSGAPGEAVSTADFSRSSIADSSAGMTRPDGPEAALQPDASSQRVEKAAEKPANFPTFQPPKVALAHVEQATGEARTTDGEAPSDAAFSYMLFESVQQAHDYAARKVAADPRLQCNIFDAAGHLLHLVRNAAVNKSES